MNDRDKSQFWTAFKRRSGSIGLAIFFVAAVVGCGRSGDGAEETTTTTSSITTLPKTTETVPETTTTTTRATTYVVQSGDSLSIIAQRFDITTDRLADFNAIANSDSIQIGQELSIPPALNDTTASTEAESTGAGSTGAGDTQPETTEADNG